MLELQLEIQWLFAPKNAEIPIKFKKAKGITEPWYKDIDEYDPQDKYIIDGIKNTDFSKIPDGEWSGELLGKNIQGNPLNLENNSIVFFSLGQAPIFENTPTSYQELKEWLPKQKANMEKIVELRG